MQDKWTNQFLDLATLVATWSKDRSRGVGCVLVGPNREVLSLGYNGFPRGVKDDVEDRHQRPEKYLWTEHAERNAIYNAVRNGQRLEGAKAYVTLCPCMDCARALIQSGVTEVYFPKPDFEDKVWGEQFKKVSPMLFEAKVKVFMV